MIPISFTPKEINILMQALRIDTEDGSIEEHAKISEVDRLRDKLQNARK
jgi:hypothetical protein